MKRLLVAAVFAVCSAAVRAELAPSVRFAAEGRYLPPVGHRTLALETVNVTNVDTCVRRVAAENIVPMLAFEEDAYAHRWRRSADSESTLDYAREERAVRKLPCLAAPDETRVVELPVAVEDGRGPYGVFLVTVLSADRPRKDWAWDDEIANPLRVRLVCVSDLALSVRELGAGGLGVWVTSLTTGRPVADATLDVRSTADVKVMEGVTDASGWCELSRCDTGEPFAVIVRAGGDTSFLALRAPSCVDETCPDGFRENYLQRGELRAFLWSDRGIYRHNESIRVQALVRTDTRRAPAAVPLELRFRNPSGRVVERRAVMTDADGAVTDVTFSVPDELPSGNWRVELAVPGEQGAVIGSRRVKIEEFVPPQVRTAVVADEFGALSNFTFTVTGEHLFGGAADGLKCEGAVVYADEPFAPEAWKGWRFGNDDLGLAPNFCRLGAETLDAEGRATFTASLDTGEHGFPRAAVRVTAQGSVIEEGGRAANGRVTCVRHLYPYYIGSTLPDALRREAGVRPRLPLVCVDPGGRPLDTPRKLVVKLERVETVYTCRRRPNGWYAWDSTLVRKAVTNGISVVTATNGVTEVELPLDTADDYAVTVTDPETRVSFGKTFYFGDWCDGTVRAPLSRPTKVKLVPDKASYRPGETPHLAVRAPFTGVALLSVRRDRELETRVLELTNATTEVVLAPVTAAMAPNLEVSLSVVQGVTGRARRLAVRAHGEATVRIAPPEDELAVSVEAKLPNLRRLEVEVAAPGASAAVVTVVDEGINLLTDEPVPDPVGFFARPCSAKLRLFDLYSRVLPVLGMDGPGAGGLKTGGGFGAELLGRVSPVASRRFRPLALSSGCLAMKDGRVRATFELPDFAGELRVTAVAWNAAAAGAAAAQRKVSPKLVIEPDAPRFAAPDDAFDLTLPVYNRSAADGSFAYEVFQDGAAVFAEKGVPLAKGASTNLAIRVRVPDEPGEASFRFRVTGLGEVHEREIAVPVRPAVAWRETAGVTRLAPGETFTPDRDRMTCRFFDSPVAELASALRWLADYPHGCLEQTTSRVFPLVAADGILAAAAPDAGTNAAAVVTAGIARVVSMIRAYDYVMWPDCDYAPWDPEVSLYASHFLFAAKTAGHAVPDEALTKVLRFLRRQACDADLSVSAYACHTLALAGECDRDRMLTLYDRRGELSLLSRSRLARAFAKSGDRKRAETLLANAESPGSVREAAFALLALGELDRDDPRQLTLVEYLVTRRDPARFSWGTTSENAHALLALGAYYRAHPPVGGERYVAWRRLELPRLEEAVAETNGISITRRFVRSDGSDAPLVRLAKGELLTVELRVGTDADRTLSDLVIEDLFPAGFEPVLAQGVEAPKSWVLRFDARDDRMLVYSRKFDLQKNDEAVFSYQVRVVSSGVFALPGAVVEGMYHPRLRACTGGGCVVVGR